MEMSLDDLTGSSFIAPDVVIDCTNVDSQISEMQERMMTIKLNEQGQRDYDAWLQNAKRIQAECKGTTAPTDTAPTDTPVPVVKKTTSLQPVLILLGLVVGGVLVYHLLKSKNETN
jgi:hypothetical protein